MPIVLLLALVLLVTSCAASRVVRWRWRAQMAREQVQIGRLVDRTGRDRATGSVYSVQNATITTPTERLDAIWTPEHLERLARFYWVFVERFSLGLVRVHYDEHGRSLCLLTPRLCLLGFGTPEYEFRPNLGVVRWPIERGLLVSRRGRGHGYLEIEVHRRDGIEDPPASGGRPMSRASVELEVSGFFPTLSSGLAYRLYQHTQSRYHVLLAYGFIRSLTTADLPESRVGRFRGATGGDVAAADPPDGRPSGDGR